MATGGQREIGHDLDNVGTLTPAPVVLDQDLAGHSTQAQTDVPTPFPAVEIMQIPASGSTSSTAVGLVQAPTAIATTSLTSTTADVMQAPSLDDTDRFVHIACLLTHVGSKVLRRLLLYHTVTPTCTLDQYLAKKRIDIDNLRKRKILNKSQMDILFPPGGSTNLGDYHITLLYTLFTNIVLTISHRDRNMIQFIREKRNEIFSHAVAVNSNDYQTFWNDIRRTLEALCKQCNDPDFENEISREIEGIQVSTVQGASLLDALPAHRKMETLERLVPYLYLMSSHARESDESDEDLVGSQLTPVVLDQDLAGHSTQAQTDVPTPFSAVEIMQILASGSTSSTAVGLVQAPTAIATTSLTSTTADVMQAPSLDDTDRFVHIACLLINVGSKVLRRLLLYHTVTPTCTLDHYLAKKRIDIDNLRKRKILNKSQMDILFPPGGSTNLGDYDITLLYALFTNIVLTISHHERNMIQFLREKRNEIFSHAKSVAVNSNDYQTFWNDIRRTLEALCKQCNDPDFENEISREIEGIQVSTVQGASLLDALPAHRKMETLERLVQYLMSSHARESDESDEDLVGSQLTPVVLDQDLAGHSTQAQTDVPTPFSAVEIMQILASGSTSSTAVGLVQAPTAIATTSLTSTTADVMQAPSLDDTDRFVHIACLLINVGSKVLRRLLLYHTVTPTCTLDHYLAKKRIDIDNLRKRKILNKSQMDILFPPGGSTNLGDYDITLLYALFTNIVLTISHHERNMIQFLREKRNEIFSHAKSVAVNSNDYQTFWNDIRRTLEALCKQCNDPDFENEISREIEGIQVSTVQGASLLDALPAHRKMETLERLVQYLMSSHARESDESDEDLVGSQLNFENEISREIQSIQVSTVQRTSLLDTLQTHPRRMESHAHESNEDLVGSQLNPLLPKEILSMDSYSIQLYKKALHAGMEKVYNIRVMVVGQFGVGKTTLIKRLLGQLVDINEKKSTEGIDVHKHCCKISLDKGEWIQQHEDSDQLHTLNRLIKLLPVPDQKPDISQEQEGISQVIYQREITSEIDATKTNVPSTTSVSDQEVQSYTQVSITRGDEIHHVEHLDKETDIVAVPLSDVKNSESEKKTKDTMMDIIRLANENVDKLVKDVDKYAAVSIWDFAGQCAFYTTHQMFLTSRAIYLLVIDLSQQINDLIKDDKCYFDADGIVPRQVFDLFQIWMNSIHSSVKSPKDIIPVILVGTHVDKIPEESRKEFIDKYFIKLRYMLKDKPTICHLMDDIAIDNTQPDPMLEVLKRRIFELSSQQPHWGEERPARWLPLEQAIMTLKASGTKIVPLSLIEEINMSGSIEIDRDELELFLKFHHDIGIILHFSVEKLRENIVLDPHWMIDALKSLITAEAFIKKYPAITRKFYEFIETGKLTHELIDVIWSEENNLEFHNHKEHILGLMKQLNIIAKPRIFSEEGKETKEEHYFLAPCVLQQKTPEEIISPKPNSQMESSPVLCYVFTGNFLPSAIFHRLVAACIAHWPVAKKKKEHIEENLIFCGCCVFQLKEKHKLTLHFRENVIFLRVTRMGIKDKTPSSKLCIEVRKFITTNLEKIIGYLGKGLEFEYFIQCPEYNGVSINSLIPFSRLKEEEVHCEFHDHILESCKVLDFWFEDQEQTAIEGIEEGKESKVSKKVEDASMDGVLSTSIKKGVPCSDPKLLCQLLQKSQQAACSSQSVLEANCLSVGLVLHGETPANGNCFFEAVSSQLRRLKGVVQKSPQELRQEVVAFMRTNRVIQASEGTIHLDSFIYNESFDVYCSRMARDGEWADHVVVVAMARMLKIDIMIVTSSPLSGPEHIVWVVGQTSFQEDPILLGHIWESHYMSLQPIEKLHRTVLNRCLPRLMKDLDVWVVMKYIRQKQLFNAVTIRDISEQTTTTDKILYLIDQIKERDQHTYVRFKECLIRAQQADLKKMLDEEEENLVAEMKEKHRGNPLEAVRPVDVLLAIISDKSIETILQMTTSLQESEIPDIEIRNVSTHLQHIHEESLTESERRKEDIFKALFDSCKNDLLNILETGEHSDDILRSALQYILLINDPSAKAAILNVAGANLKSKLSNPDCDVWGGLDVRIDSKCRVSLVCLHRGNLKTQPDSNLGLPVLYQEYDRIEREPFEASFSNEYHTSISPEDLRRANILINKHGEELFKIHTNLVAISPSSVLSSKSRGLKIEPSIVLYCRMKGVIPIGENHFPKTLELEGIILSTDIREGLFTFAMHEQAQQNSFRPTDRNDKLRMGCSIGVENVIYSGTLGPFVRLGSDVGFITCAHVVGFDNQTIVQPAYGDSNETETACGTVLDVQFNPDKPVDAALIKVNNRDVAPTDFTWNSPSNVLNAGFDVTKPPSFLGGSVRMDTDFSDAQGKRVIKCGKVTGLTKGSLALNGTMIKIEDCALPFPAGITWNGSSVVVMKNQYQVENNRYPFGTFGDSGAGVYLVENEQNNLSLIGILIGFLNNNTVVTPIRPVLESLKLKPEDVISR